MLRLALSLPILGVLLFTSTEGFTTPTATLAFKTTTEIDANKQPTDLISACVFNLALSVNDTVTNAALTGTPRQIVLTNTSAIAANNVTYTISPSLPSGTTLSPASCGTIAPSASCTLTVTPGATPTSARGLAPTPSIITLKGSNTNAVTASVVVLTYGNIYQSGYIYSVNDTTPTTGSIGGKVTQTTDNSGAPSGIVWDSDPSCISGSCYVTFADSPSNGTNVPTGNTYLIYQTLTTTHAENPTSYAAGLCTGTLSGYSDWYLPAECEMGYGNPTIAVSCGTSGSPALQNMQSNLIDIGNTDIAGLTTGATFGVYWGSTEDVNAPTLNALEQKFGTFGFSAQNSVKKSNPFTNFGVRCSRALTF